MADPANTVGAVGGPARPARWATCPIACAAATTPRNAPASTASTWTPRSKTPVFLDRGRRLVASRSDPNAVRDMVAIAQHRGWSFVEVRGTPGFRREAWLAGRTVGPGGAWLRSPPQRDLQELDRRQEGQARLDARLKDLERGVAAGGSHRGASDRLKVVEAVVKSRIAEADAQDRLLRRARERVADLLERGASFDAPRQREPGRERRHSR